MEGTNLTIGELAWGSGLITDHIEAIVGFRGLYVNYDDGSGDDKFELDLWFYNPFIALNFTF